MQIMRIMSVLVASLALSVSSLQAHEHTHIGLNQDGLWGTADDNKLWIFATPGSPQWPTLTMELITAGPLAGKYIAELDCWHSAHPQSGLFQLGGSDQAVAPQWQIVLQRESFSPGFTMYSPWFVAILISDGAAYNLPSTYMTDKYDENGLPGAWGIHHHLYFVADAAGPGETFQAIFTVADLGSTGYASSDPYVMNFVTVPEPASMALLAAGLLCVSGYRRRKAGVAK